MPQCSFRIADINAARSVDNFGLAAQQEKDYAGKKPITKLEGRQTE
jgi:hypothetical protein